MMALFIEELYFKIGWGTYQRYLLTMSALILFSNAFCVSLFLFVLPATLNDSRFDAQTVLYGDTIILCGMTISYSLLGVVSDIYGRKCVMFILLVIQGGNYFLVGLSNGSKMILITLFFTSFCGHGSSFAAKINFVEFMREHSRGYYSVFLDVFVVLGYASAAALPWALKANGGESIYLISWRVFCVITTGLGLLTSSLTSMLQMNPRNLLIQLRKMDAHLVMQNMFVFNHSEHTDNCTVTKRELRHLVETIPMTTQFGTDDKVLLLCERLITIKERLQERFQKFLLCIAAIRTSLFAGCLMSTIWMTRSVDFHPVSWNKRFAALQTLCNKSNATILNIHPLTYFNFVTFSLCGAIALFTVMCIVDMLGRKRCLMFALVCAGTACLHLGIFNIPYLRYGLAAFYMSFIHISNSMLDLIATENTPTALRGTILGFSYIPVCLIGIMARNWINFRISIGFYVIALACIGLLFISS